MTVPDDDYPAHVLALTDYYCNGRTGRPALGDAVVEHVTEGRQQQTELMRQHQKKTGVPVTAFYSSCADLVHCLYFHLGVVLPWVNREESKQVDGTGWLVQKNIQLLADGSKNACVERCAAGDVYEPGDCLHIGTPGTNNDHVMIVRSHVGDVVEVAEYGQPGGKVNDHMLVTRQAVHGLAAVFMGSRQLRTFLRLRRVLEAADEAELLYAPDPRELRAAAIWSFSRGTGHA